jgi:hypothetical protein
MKRKPAKLPQKVSAGKKSLSVIHTHCRHGIVKESLSAVVKCNCSVCTMKQNKHIIIPESQFTLLRHTMTQTLQLTAKVFRNRSEKLKIS